VPFNYTLYAFIYTTQRVVCFWRLCSCAVCIMGTVRVAGLSQMNSILGTGARHRFFQPTMTFRILSMRLRSQNKAQDYVQHTFS
jgi:hypothetical protein